MVRYVVLLDFTQQGINKFSETLSRSESFNKLAEQAGVQVKAQYWTSGGHDGVLVLEGPDESSLAALLLRLGAEGNMRTQTLRAFDRAEMQSIVGKAR